MEVIEGHGRSWKVVEGHGRSLKVREGHGRSWKIMEDHGRSWKVMEGHGRSRKVKEGHGWSFPIAGLTFQVRKVCQNLKTKLTRQLRLRKAGGGWGFGGCL